VGILLLVLLIFGAGLWTGLYFGARYGMYRLGQSEMRGRMARVRRRD
jgi:hypothetical protein